MLRNNGTRGDNLNIYGLYSRASSKLQQDINLFLPFNTAQFPGQIPVIYYPSCSFEPKTLCQIAIIVISTKHFQAAIEKLFIVRFPLIFKILLLAKFKSSYSAPISILTEFTAIKIHEILIDRHVLIQCICTHVSSAVKSLKELVVSVNEHGKSVCISPEVTRLKDGLVSKRSDYVSCFISTLLLIAWPEDDSLVSAEYFVLGKSLALCSTTLYGLAHVTAVFT
ncbi:hypothetical protein PsorP6_006037 [Peronosclerospora sorghi]|uniref:Uncharacterized protein n=1 Tax=Peronosclerospora sorghi TaxID=230839 RepID=A0ACC0W694_9STRA|nr:hypothetical protein PsorP6_006037 [Peronosclerospora sorghi]